MTTTRPALILDPTYANLNEAAREVANSPEVRAYMEACAARDRRGAELILEAAPAPTLPCPTWCQEDHGPNGWDQYDGELTRHHYRHLPIPGLDNADVLLSRHDAATSAGVAEAVESGTKIDPPQVGEGITLDQAQAIVDVMLEAIALVRAGRTAGDPERGRIDVDA